MVASRASMGGKLRLVWQVTATSSIPFLGIDTALCLTHRWKEALASWREMGIPSGVTWPDTSGICA